jgi:hypothetical protein
MRAIRAEGSGGWKAGMAVPGVLMRTVVWMWGAGGTARSKQLYAWRQEQGGIVDVEDIDGRFRWMGRKVRWAGLKSNEMGQVRRRPGE